MFELIAVMTSGQELVIHRGNTLQSVRAAHDRVVRNPDTVKMIEVRDHEGSQVDVIWNANWMRAH